jgi:TRAP-type C4-dicarboxylate transport system permease large subunit
MTQTPLTLRDDAPAAVMPHDVIRRSVIVLGLLAMALIHLLDLNGKLHETPYLGGLYIVLIISSLLVAQLVAVRDARWVYWAATLIAAGTIAGYALSRTTGLPSASGDIGNWLEPLGLASLFVEAIVVLAALPVLVRRG